MTKCVLYLNSLSVFVSGVELLIGSNTRAPRVRVVIGLLRIRRGSAGYGEREIRKCQGRPNRFRNVFALLASLKVFRPNTAAGQEP